MNTRLAIRLVVDRIAEHGLAGE